MTESCIEAAMGFMGEPDEVGGSIVGVVTVKVMTLMVAATGSNPCESNEEMTIRSTSEVSHPRIVGMDVGFGMEVLGLVVMNFVESSGREGEEPALFGTIEFGNAYSRDCVLAEADLCAIRQK